MAATWRQGSLRGSVCAFMTETGNGARFSATPNYGDLISGVDFAADGRLATASRDGAVRFYDRDFKQIVARRRLTGGARPFRIAFSPDGTMVAVGYDDTARVDLLDGHSLAPLLRPNVDDIRSLAICFMSPGQKNGRTLYAGGTFERDGIRPSGF